jgi:hypothetical protein
MIANDCGIIETHIDSIIDAVSLSEVISRKSEQSIMQAACNNLCARLAEDAFVSIGRGNGIAGFWGQSLFRAMTEISISSCGKLCHTQYGKYRCMAI